MDTPATVLLSTKLGPSQMDPEKVPPDPSVPKAEPPVRQNAHHTVSRATARAAHGGTFWDVWTSRGLCVPVEGGDGPRDPSSPPSTLGP